MQSEQTLGRIPSSMFGRTALWLMLGAINDIKHQPPSFDSFYLAAHRYENDRDEAGPLLTQARNILTELQIDTGVSDALYEDLRGCVRIDVPVAIENEPGHFTYVARGNNQIAIARLTDILGDLTENGITHLHLSLADPTILADLPSSLAIRVESMDLASMRFVICPLKSEDDPDAKPVEMYTIGRDFSDDPYVGSVLDVETSLTLGGLYVNVLGDCLPEVGQYLNALTPAERKDIHYIILEGVPPILLAKVFDLQPGVVNADIRVRGNGVDGRWLAVYNPEERRVPPAQKNYGIDSYVEQQG